MNHYYLDTTALVKYYVDETGSDWMRKMVGARPMPLLVIAHLATVEMSSALVRRLREDNLTNMDYARLRLVFRRDCLNRYLIIRSTVSLVEHASDLLEQYTLSAYEAVHLATALAANRSLVDRGQAALTFLSASDRLNQAANGEGLVTDNPSRHA